MKIHLDSKVYIPLHLRGLKKDFFSIVYSFQEKSPYRANRAKVARDLGCCEREVVDVINSLLESGYISRQKVSTEHGHPTYEYKAHLEALMERVKAGEDVRPTPIKRRGKKAVPQSVASGESPRAASGESPQIRVVNHHEKSGESPPLIHINKYPGDISPVSISLQEVEREVYASFFFRGAKDPKNCTRLFIASIQRDKWRTRHGTPIDSLEQVIALAELWDCLREGRRWQEGPETETFLRVWRKIYACAVHSGDIDPYDILDTRINFWRDDDIIRLVCSDRVRVWCETHLDIISQIYRQAYGPKIKLIYIGLNKS